MSISKQLSYILSLALISGSSSFGATPAASYRVKATIDDHLTDAHLRLTQTELVVEIDGQRRAALPLDGITSISYSYSKRPRIGAALGVAIVCIPCGMAVAFSKKRAHWLTVGAEGEGAVAMQLHKKRWRQIAKDIDVRAPRAALEMVSEEGETFQAAAPEQQKEAAGLLVIDSPTAGAEVYINGAFNGLTPRRKAVQPGEYQIRVVKAGAGDFVATVDVGISQTVEVDALLQ